MKVVIPRFVSLVVFFVLFSCSNGSKSASTVDEQKNMSSSKPFSYLPKGKVELKELKFDKEWNAVTLDISTGKFFREKPCDLDPITLVIDNAKNILVWGGSDAWILKIVEVNNLEDYIGLSLVSAEDPSRKYMATITPHSTNKELYDVVITSKDSDELPTTSTFVSIENSAKYPIKEIPCPN